jgi:hypothetical protein
MSVSEVMQLIQKIETIFRNSSLPKEYQEKALNYLANAQESLEEDEPDKIYAAKSL